MNKKQFLTFILLLFLIIGASFFGDMIPKDMVWLALIIGLAIFILILWLVRKKK